MAHCLCNLSGTTDIIRLIFMRRFFYCKKTEEIMDNKILERIFRKYMRKEDLEKQIELDRAKSGMI